jgi:type I restriction enzyme, S subunit
MIQAKWKKGRLTDFISLKRGFDITKKESVTGSVWVYSSSGRSYRNSVARVRGPGVITGRKGILGKVFYSEEDFWPHDTTLWVDDFKGNNPKYVCWFLRSLHLERFDAASSVPTLNRNSVLPIQVKFPPLQQQESISKLLDTWDEALEKLDALIQAKEQRKKALMQQLLTGKKRLKGFDGEWVEVCLGDLFTQRKETNRSDLPLLSITANRGVVRRNELDKKDSSNEDKSKYQRIVPGDIGYNTMRMWQGVSALSSLEGIVSPAYTICSPTDLIIGRFAAHLFKLPRTISLFHRYSQGLVDDTLNLKYPNFAVIRVFIPKSTNEQQAIAETLDTCNEELSLLRKQRDVIDHQKRGLMQRLLTGKIRVNI